MVTDEEIKNLKIKLYDLFNEGNDDPMFMNHFERLAEKCVIIMRDQMQQALIDAAGKAFDAGVIYWSARQIMGTDPNPYPDKETYLKTLTQK